MDPIMTSDAEKAWVELVARSHMLQLNRAREDEEMRQEFYLGIKAAIVAGNQESFEQKLAWYDFQRKQLEILRHHENLVEARSLFDSIVTNGGDQATARTSAIPFAGEATQNLAFAPTNPTSSVSGVSERQLSSLSPPSGSCPIKHRPHLAIDSTVSASDIHKAAETSLRPLVPLSPSDSRCLVPSHPTQHLDYYVPVGPVTLTDDKATTSRKRKAAPKIAIENGGEDKGKKIRSSVTATSPLKPLGASTTLANNVPLEARVTECPKGSKRYFIFLCPLNNCRRYMDNNASMYAHLNQGSSEHLSLLNEKTFIKALSVGGIEVIDASVEWVDEHNKAAKALNAARFS